MQGLVGRVPPQGEDSSPMGNRLREESKATERSKVTEQGLQSPRENNGQFYYSNHVKTRLTKENDRYKQ